METRKILWTDDEIEMLKPYIIFLQEQGYDVESVTNGADALTRFAEEDYDMVILDENMPGMRGLDVLVEMKKNKPNVPVVMMTKSEALDTMKSAFGSQIDDYLVKPVSLNSMLISLTRIFESKKLVADNLQRNYLSEYQSLAMRISECRTFADWSQLYKRIVYWELALEGNKEMVATQQGLKQEANSGFAKFIQKNYLNWIKSPQATDSPLLSHRILSEKVKPLIKEGKKVALVVIDNFRFDQWEVLYPLLADDFKITTDTYCAILPTATQFARNAIFSGLLPADIKKLVPKYWVDEAENEESLNQYERELLSDYFERQRMSSIKCAYYKVGSNESGQNLIKKFGGYEKNNLNAIVYNFIDMLSHARSDDRTIKDLIPDDAAYRSVTRSWFTHGTLNTMLDLLRRKGFTIILTTDHGTIRVSKPIEITGTKSINSNMRYKTDKLLKYDARSVFVIERPQDAGIPTVGISTPYIFAQNDDFFVYPNNKNEYVKIYNDSFQHGGISMEEMILPLITLEDK